MVTTSHPAATPEPRSGHDWFPFRARSGLAGGQLVVLVSLLVLTIGAWVLTIQQTQTMPMPMGVVVREEPAASERPVSADGMADMGSATREAAGAMAATGMGSAAWSLAAFACWALFAVLVAAGVMSLAWMLLLTLVVFAEKVLPGGQRASYVVGAALLVLGVAVVTRVIAFPWMV